MTLQELLAALRAAPGPSRELDAEIARLDGWTFLEGLWSHPTCGFASCEPDYTSSLDAAAAFRERMLPGWYARVEPRFYIEDERVKWLCILIRPLWDKWTPFGDWFDTIEDAPQCATECLSIVAAVVAGVIAKEN